jgi:hypothetical protein
MSPKTFNQWSIGPYFPTSSPTSKPNNSNQGKIQNMFFLFLFFILLLALSGGAIAGLTIMSIAIFALFGFSVYYYFYVRNRRRASTTNLWPTSDPHENLSETTKNPVYI